MTQHRNLHKMLENYKEFCNNVTHCTAFLTLLFFSQNEYNSDKLKFVCEL